jgi:hypothetical protein
VTAAKFKIHHKIIEARNKLMKTRLFRCHFRLPYQSTRFASNSSRLRISMGDQVEAELTNNIVNMMYMLGPILEDEDPILQLVELVGKELRKCKDVHKHATVWKQNPRKILLKHTKTMLLTKIKTTEMQRN